MAISYRRAGTYIASILKQSTVGEVAARLKPKMGSLPPAVPFHSDISLDAVANRWNVLNVEQGIREQLLDEQTARQMDHYKHNIENFVGTAKIPIGLAGPLRVNGLFAQGDFYLPLATTEASLVASYNRGANIISEVGGASAMVLSEGVSRSPVFSFANFEELGLFIKWALEHESDIERVAESTTRFGKLVDLELSIEGSTAYFLFVYTTGDAAGQNMVTIATHAAVQWMIEHTPVIPRCVYLESNFSGDKKASAQSLQNVRGKKVTAEVLLPSDVIERRLHTTAERIVELYQLSILGGVLSGTLGIQGHYANGLAALFIACGQDAACVAEAAVGTTVFQLRAERKLHVSVTLPNLIVGTVGGGTGLPSQRSCLEILGLTGPGNARAFAEVAAALCLAGEISITAALAAGEFAQAHARLARGRDVEKSSGVSPGLPRI
jgi:hydroxymethylglutaryl-CoA reductase (NADPH)